MRDELANEHDVQDNVDAHKITSDHIEILHWDRRKYELHHTSETNTWITK